jgi:prevent-host-death family protein
MLSSYSIAEARNQLARIVHDAEKGQFVELTRRGKPVAVLVSAHEYERLCAAKENFWEALCRFRDDSDLKRLNIDFPPSAQLRTRLFVAPFRCFRIQARPLHGTQRNERAWNSWARGTTRGLPNRRYREDKRLDARNQQSARL